MRDHAFITSVASVFKHSSGDALASIENRTRSALSTAQLTGHETRIVSLLHTLRSRVVFVHPDDFFIVPVRTVSIGDTLEGWIHIG